jgi:hypothetical protein
MKQFFSSALQFAEIMDSWRVVPRIIVTVYGYLVYKLYTWYRSLETIELRECDNAILNTLLERGIEVDRAMELSCSIVGITGGPTTEQTAFVTAIIGLSTAIFAFYVKTGRQWDDRGNVKYDPNVANSFNNQTKPN